MALPSSRDLTFVAGTSEVPAATLNALQDAVVETEEVRRGSAFWFYDDFCGSTFTGMWAGVAGTVAQIDDSAAGAIGAVKLSNAGTGTASLTGPTAAFGTSDFRLDAKVRIVVASTGNGRVCVDAGATEVGFQWDGAVDGNWYYKIDAASAVDTGVAHGTAYKLLSIRRSGGNIAFYIDGTLIYSGAYASSLTGASAPFLTISAAATTDVRFDYVKLWIDR